MNAHRATQQEPSAVAWRPSLWLLALVAGLLPAVASVLALVLSARAGQIAECNPLLEGCVSISRAARQPAALPVFRALLLPAATLQALVWLLQAWQLHVQGQRSSARWLAVLGIGAGTALVAYGSFLGTEGEAYRWLRRYGTVVSFGGTFLAMLVLARARGAQGRITTAVLAAIVTLGLGNVLAGVWTVDPLKDRIENITEWWCALGLTVCFVKLALDWRRDGLAVRLEPRQTPPRPDGR